LHHCGAHWCYEAIKQDNTPKRQPSSKRRGTDSQPDENPQVSSNRMLVELIENGIEAEKRKQQEFFKLAERFRNATDPEEAKRLGDELGRMVFGD